MSNQWPAHALWPCVLICWKRFKGEVPCNLCSASNLHKAVLSKSLRSTRVAHCVHVRPFQAQFGQFGPNCELATVYMRSHFGCSFTVDSSFIRIDVQIEFFSLAVLSFLDEFHFFCNSVICSMYRSIRLMSYLLAAPVTNAGKSSRTVN